MLIEGSRPKLCEAVRAILVALLVSQASTAQSANPCGDVNDSGTVTASDALAVLGEAVGQDSALVCPAPSTPLSTGQMLSYGPGDDGDLRLGEPLAYVDNGDGTITDTKTALMWEKKLGLDSYSNIKDCTNEQGRCQNPHAGTNTYTFGVTEPEHPAYDGTVVTIFLNQLNNRCDRNTAISCSENSDCSGPGGMCGFAGHRDWRLPNIRELETIMDFSVASPQPTVNAAFNTNKCGLPCVDVTKPNCSCTTRGGYWSSTTNANVSWYAWAADFDGGSRITNVKYMTYFARAVRGGY
jgi:hypothetical protein